MIAHGNQRVQHRIAARPRWRPRCCCRSWPRKPFRSPWCGQIPDANPPAGKSSSPRWRLILGLEKTMRPSPPECSRHTRDAPLEMRVAWAGPSPSWATPMLVSPETSSPAAGPGVNGTVVTEHQNEMNGIADRAGGGTIGTATGRYWSPQPTQIRKTVRMPSKRALRQKIIRTPEL